MLSSALSLSWMHNIMVKRVMRYCILGGVGTLIYVGILMVLVEFFNLQPTVGSILGFFCVILIVYLPHHFWVFESNRAHHSSFTRFVVVSAIGLLANTGIMYGVVHIIGMNYMWGVLGATAVVPPLNFLLNSYWTFK